MPALSRSRFGSSSSSPWPDTVPAGGLPSGRISGASCSAPWCHPRPAVELREEHPGGRAIASGPRGARRNTSRRPSGSWTGANAEGGIQTSCPPDAEPTASRLAPRWLAATRKRGHGLRRAESARRVSAYVVARDLDGAAGGSGGAPPRAPGRSHRYAQPPHVGGRTGKGGTASGGRGPLSQGDSGLAQTTPGSQGLHPYGG